MLVALMLLFLLATPLAVMLLARRWRWINTVSPMSVLYVIGLLVANGLPLPDEASALCSSVGDVAVMLAIPLMLMGCSLKGWSTRLALKVFLSGMVAVLAVSVGGFFLFRGDSDPLVFAQICGAASGIYTGGIANVGAIARGVGMENEPFLLLTSYDLIGTGLYLVFVILCGKRLFRWLLPARTEPLTASHSAAKHSVVESAAESSAVESAAESAAVESAAEQGCAHAPQKVDGKGALLALGLAVAIAGVAYGLASLRDGEVDMTVLILLLTSLAIGASFLPPMRRQEVSFDMGLYGVYLFCFCIACGCNVRALDLLGSLNILYYILFVIFGSLILQVLLAKLLHIDGDSVLVCSVALINSPPFVPLVAALLDNKRVMMLGISIGLLGYMLGNYLGIGIFRLLMALA